MTRTLSIIYLVTVPFSILAYCLGTGPAFAGTIGAMTLACGAWGYVLRDEVKRRKRARREAVARSVLARAGRFPLPKGMGCK
jgi:hypothetical protein